MKSLSGHKIHRDRDKCVKQMFGVEFTHSCLLIKLLWNIFVFDEFINYTWALSWPFPKRKINACVSARLEMCCLDEGRHLGKSLGRKMKVRGVADIHPRQLFMNIKDQLWMAARSRFFLSSIILKHWNTLQWNSFLPSKVFHHLAQPAVAFHLPIMIREEKLILLQQKHIFSAFTLCLLEKR